MHTKKDGTIERSAKKYFLNVKKDGSQAAHYENSVPLATVHPISQQPEYHLDAIDSAWKLVDGSATGLANRAISEATAAK